MSVLEAILEQEIRILYVDNCKFAQKDLKRNLEEFHRFKIDTVSSPYQALQLLKTKKYDIIISDYVMDDVDNPYPHAVLNFYGEELRKLGSIHLWPNAEGLSRVLGFNNLVFREGFKYPTKAINYFINESPYASWFKHAKIIAKTGGSLLPRAAIPEPYVGNILVISDAAAFIEVENH